MKGLDKWLTTEPDNGWDNYFDAVINNLTDLFWLQYCDHEKVDIVLTKLFNSDKSPKESAQILMRVFKLYKV